MKDNRNEYTQLTIENLQQTTVFEIVDNAEEETFEPGFCKNQCMTRNMLNCCTCMKYNKFDIIGGEL